MSEPVDAVDGIEFTSGDVRCPCGRVFHLFWNGGELDNRTCECGRRAWTEHVKTVLRVKDKKRR